MFCLHIILIYFLLQMQPKEAKTIKNAMPYLMRNLNVDHSFLSKVKERAILRPYAIEVISVRFFERSYYM